MNKVTRRDFLKTLGLGALVLTTGFPEVAHSYERISENFFETPAGRQRLNLIKARQQATYQDDRIVREKFKLAASHENPSIKEFYTRFAHHPLSEISEKLLHTSYHKRK